MLQLRTETQLVVLQPTGFCNIDCTYCYLAGRSNTARMSIATVERIFTEVFESKHSSTLYVVWHAGEPTVVSPGWYEQAYERIDQLRPAGTQVQYQLQTNAMLIGAEWARFLKTSQSNTEVRVSIDGPEDLHDLNRRSRNGKGTFGRVMKGIEQLQLAQVKFGVLTVLTATSLRLPDRLFDFYKSLGVSDIAFNFEEIEGINRSTSLRRPDAVELYSRFLRRLCELLKQHGLNWRVRQIDQAVNALLGGWISSPGELVLGQFLSFDHSGGVASFSPELLTAHHPSYGSFVLGNIHETSLEHVLSSPRAQRIADDIARGVDLCRSSCNYFRYCGGGYCSNKLFENGSFASTETLNCRLRVKATIDAVLQEMGAALQDYWHEA
jgi:uncharacterized protein